MFASMGSVYARVELRGRSDRAAPCEVRLVADGTPLYATHGPGSLLEETAARERFREAGVRILAAVEDTTIEEATPAILVAVGTLRSALARGDAILADDVSRILIQHTQDVVLSPPREYGPSYSPWKCSIRKSWSMSVPHCRLKLIGGGVRIRRPT